MGEAIEVDIVPTRDSELTEEESLTPAEIVSRLDAYIIAQSDAKRAVAIALRNRWRRLQVPEDIREEITPKNIIMIGPTGVGKTEISRRLAKLVRAPFVKVEASKFTEVGYVGRDVESIIRDLAEASYNMVREEEQAKVLEEAKHSAEERLLDLLLPGSVYDTTEINVEASEARSFSVDGRPDVILQDNDGIGYVAQDDIERESVTESTRSKLKGLLQAGKLEERMVEIEITKQPMAQMQVLGPQGLGEIEGQIKDMFQNMVPKTKETKRMKVSEAREVLIQEEQENLINPEKIADLAVDRAEQTGIVFIDEIDKVCGQTASAKGPDVSREGVQRDLLPLVEGSSVSTRYGLVSTEHILFIASGAFHTSKPSDLMPEFQGRFPIRVELRSLTPKDFEKILVEPKNALTKQYEALLRTEEVEIEFTRDSIEELARLTAEVNSRTENIGARRLHTILEKLLEELSFSAKDHAGEKIVIDRNYVQDRLSDIAKDSDLSKYIL